MESSTADGKKKRQQHEENTFMATTESGTLKVKIRRHDQPSADDTASVASMSSFLFSKSAGKRKRNSRRAAVQPQSMASSPPKPRPNRKHVPIFYEPQFRQPIQRRDGQHSSKNEIMDHSTLSTNTPDMRSSSAAEAPAAHEATLGASSLPLHISDVRLRAASTNEAGCDPPLRTSSLFIRNDTDGLRRLGDFQVSCPDSSSLCSTPSSRRLRTVEMASSTKSQEDPNAGRASVLHHTSLPSTQYPPALHEATASTQVQLPTTSSADDCIAIATMSDSSTNTLPWSSERTDRRMNERLEDSRIALLLASQNGNGHAPYALSARLTPNEHSDKHREMCGPNNSTLRFGCSSATHRTGNISMVTDSGLLSRCPPPLSVPDLLLEGGAEFPALPFKIDSNKDTSTRDCTDDCAKDTSIPLGSPPDDPPAFLSHNSLTGGGIPLSNLLATRSSPDRPESFSSLTNETNKTIRDLDSVLAPQSKTGIGPDRLVPITIVCSEFSDPREGMTVAVPHITTAGSNSSSSSSDATNNTESSSCNATSSLGSPPRGPPAFTIGNSLMGGGIELQPAASNVNTHNFDWKLHKAVSNIGDASRLTSHR
uniref:Uncharacterized protein n=1 Tax=Peronospora matthiolae TaxID=2874970 RepID=A0AAV1TRS5_9STRA